MAKSKKRPIAKTTRRKIEQAQAQPPEQQISPERIRSLRRTTILLILACFVMTGLVKLAPLFNLWKSNQLKADTPFIIAFALLVILLPASMILVIWAIIDNISKQPVKTAIFKLKSIIVFTSLVMAVAFLILLYSTGAINYFGKLVYKLLPALGAYLSNLASQVLGWIVSGVLGNTAYDFLKNKLLGKDGLPKS